MTTSEERRESAVRVLNLMEPIWAHDDKCPAQKRSGECKCYILRNNENRAAALDEAGLLCALAEGNDRGRIP